MTTAYDRGYYGNFASAVPADAGAQSQCLSSMSKKKQSNKDDFIIPVRPTVENQKSTPKPKPAE